MVEARYLRNIPALTEAECVLLRQKRVVVVGCGGLGGYLIELLARLGVGTIRAVDGDVFEASNLNRQLLSEVSLLGVNKAKTAADRIHRVNPDVKIEAVEEFMTEANVLKLLTGCDAVLDGLDSVAARKILARACSDVGVPYIYGAVGGWVAQAAVSMPGDGLIERLYPEEPATCGKSVLPFTPALCAALQASLCAKLLTGRAVETGKLYCFDLLEQEFDAVSMEMGGIL